MTKNARAGIVTCLLTIWSAASEASPSLASPKAKARLEALVHLGARLFGDERLSGDGRVSCATCHRQEHAFTDGLRVARGISARTGSRNAPSLLDAGSRPFFAWDGRRTRLEDQVVDPFLNTREHGLPNRSALLRIIESDSTYRLAFDAAFGPGRPIELSRVGDALAAFVRTLTAGESAFDRYWLHGDKAALSEAQRRGLRTFRERGQCSTCHLIGDRALFTDDRFHSIYVSDGTRKALPGLWALLQVTAPEGIGELVAGNVEVAALGRFVATRELTDIASFRTPSLRNVAVTAPYMHDGSVETLAEAVEREAYYRTRESSRPVFLTPAETGDLVAFLKSLTSTEQTRSTRVEQAETDRPP
jgi:cytochrome c peroxidase